MSDLPTGFDRLGAWEHRGTLRPGICRMIDYGTWVYFIVSWDARSGYIGTTIRLGRRLANHWQGGTGVHFHATQAGLPLADLDVYVLQVQRAHWAERWATRYAQQAGFVVWNGDGHAPSLPVP